MSRPHVPVVLVVEDEQNIRSFFSKALELGGFAAVEAATAEAGLRMLQDGFRPDAVLLDLSMPGMGGFGFLKRLQASPDWGAIPVAIVTGHILVPDDVKATAEELGVQVHHKPVDLEGLLKLTNDLLAQR